MNLIDIVALIGIAYGAYKGFRNGAIKEAAGLIGLAVGVWAGLRLAFVFANYYRDNFDIPENYVPLLAFLSAFMLGIGVIYLLGRVTSGFINSVGIGLPNQLGGLIFGAAKWAFLLGTAFTLVANSGFITPEKQEESLTYPFLHTYSTKVQDYTVGLVPAVTNVLTDVEGYFVELDSTRRANGGLPEPEVIPSMDPDQAPSEP